ncbi:hypothetical protein KTC92_16590 [Clostridium sp. CM027]|uniref:hypothetical protein n=1 Tax=Clostridium sp. CM027 TaxID=2849865 RepID=UPI001C6E9F74|nr:hypothetical protein [Clostridium sp. CM027]MBW9144551.1 hypothetical protein [Clostridium sp. CM027]UVE40685.1 hypothetical protein KTC92_16590 [Clostridium sp. CM027]
MDRTDIPILIQMAYMLFITILSLVKQRKLIIQSKHSKIFSIVMLLIGAILGSLMIYKRQKSFEVLLGLGLFIEFYLISKLRQGIYENGFLACTNSSTAWSQVKRVEIYNKTHEVKIMYYNNAGPNDLAFEKKSLNSILYILREHLDNGFIKIINKI